MGFDLAVMPGAVNPGIVGHLSVERAGRDVRICWHLTRPERVLVLPAYLVAVEDV
jgi:hypothetical protein